MSDEYDHAADLRQQIDPASIYNRIIAATLGNPGDDVEQGQAVMDLALELSARIAALEDVRDAAVEMRQYVSYRDVAAEEGSAFAAKKLKAWDAALAAVGQGETK